jgi:hypothetical protein
MDTPQERTWKNSVAACFGAIDQKFASHPLDEKRAKAMIQEARKSGASTTEILAEIRNHLISKNARQEHIDEQMAYARKLVG